MPQLDFLTYPLASQLFWLFISFFSLYLFSQKIFIPRISNVLLQRKEAIEKSIKEAEKLKLEALAKKDHGQEILAEAKIKANNILKEISHELSKSEAAALKKAQIELNLELTKFSSEIESIKQNSKKEFTDTVIELVKYILSKTYQIEKTNEEIAKFVEVKNDTI